jgi:hypothetical protein
MNTVIPDDMNKAQRLAETAQFFAMAAMLLIGVGIAFQIVAPSLELFGSGNTVRQKLQQFSLVLLEAVPAMFLFEAIKHLSKALRHFEKGEFFGREAPACIARAGDLALKGMIAAMLIVPVLSLWITARGGFDLRIEPEFLGMLTFALFISLTGRILGAAASLKEENDAFI